MFRLVAVLLLCLVHVSFCQANPQQLIQQELKKEDVNEAKRQLGLFLVGEREFPKRYAVKSEFDISVRNAKANHDTSGTQWFAFDEPSNRWIADTTFKIVHNSKVDHKQAQCYFSKGALSIKESGDFGEDWQVINLDNVGLPIFHPRFAWAASSNDLTSSFSTTSLDLLENKDCVGTIALGRLSGSFWTQKKHQGLNRISGIFFDQVSSLVHAKLLPSIQGDFDAEAVKKIQQSSGFECEVDLRWKTIENQVRVLERLDSRETNAAGDTTHMTIKSVWLVGDKVSDEYFTDPQLAPTPSLRALKFKE